MSCLTIEESKTLLGLCRAGRLYDVERWIASGKSIRTSPEVKKTPRRTAVDLGFHSLVELLARNESRQEQKDRALADAVDRALSGARFGILIMGLSSQASVNAGRPNGG